MSYQINKTDGTILTDLVDGQVDKNSTNLVLVGKNYTGFGEFINENFVKLLENFSNSAAPSNPLIGQTWWDTSENKLKVYNGATWKSTNIAYTESSAINKTEGDVWIDSIKKQLIMYDGTKEVIVGPIYTATEGKSGFEVAAIQDVQGINTVLKFWIANVLVGIFSNVTFTPIVEQQILELVTTNNSTGIIYKGFNAIAAFEFVGTALASRGLLADDGTIKLASSFLKADASSSTTGTLTIKNTEGLTIGPNTNTIQKISGNTFQLENQLENHDISIRVKTTGAQTVDAIYIDASAKNVGIFKNHSDSTLEVGGNLTVGGDLTVIGNTTQVEISTLIIERKTLELAAKKSTTDDNTTFAIGTDLTIDGGGIVLKSTDSDKSLIWINASDAWTANTNIDLDSASSSYKINGVEKLKNNSLVNVSSAPQLTSIGTLTSLNVNGMTFNGTTITTPANINLVAQASNITLNPATTIDIVGSKRITGLGAPIDAKDAANKNYVEQTITSSPSFFSLDITGLGTGATLISNVSNILNTLSPPTLASNGKLVTILTVSYENTTVGNINVDPTKAVTYTYVDANGTLNKSVVENITFPTKASGTVSLTPIRTYMIYGSSDTAWIHQGTIPYT